MAGAACPCGLPHPLLRVGVLRLQVAAALQVHGSRALTAFALTQRQAIEQATAESLAQAGAYTDELLAASHKHLDRAAKAVKAEILALGNLTQFAPDRQGGKLVQLTRLKALEKNLAAAGARLKADLSLAYQGMTAKLAKTGIEGTLAKLGALKLPGYSGLDQAGREALAEGAFSLVPTDAFDFLSGYQLQLLGKLTDDMVAGVKGVVQGGLLHGEGPAVMARRIGGIVKDPEEFRQAGKTVFKTVQQRAELIARSETMRAYNQGARKFEAQIGVTKVVWLTAGDERMCPECEPLDGKEYPLTALPSQPLHPACRCTHVPGAGDLSQITDLATLEAQVASSALTPQTVVDAVQQGDYKKLTVVQLREVAKGKSVSIARTKADRIALLSEASGQNPDWLAGHTMTELDVWFKQHKIGALKSKDELIHALLKALNTDEAAKWAAAKAAEKAALAAAKQADAATQATEVFSELKTAMTQAASPATSDEYFALIKQYAQHLEDALAIVGPAKAQEWQQVVTQIHAAYLKVVGGLPQKELRQLLQKSGVKHAGWYSKTDAIKYYTSSASRAELADQAAAKALAAQEAAKQQKALKKAAPPSPATVAAPTSPAVLARSADEAWAELKATNPFTFEKDASELGGAHTKYFYRDQAGDRWLFKPISEEFRAWGDEVAYLIQREVDPEAIEVRFIELKDMRGRLRAGSIQKMKQGLKHPVDYRSLDLAALPPEELVQIQREHVVDWLISNHDGHAAQFLRTEDGRVYSIDKGQLYKFLGKDHLSIDYHPNEPYGTSEPLYNTLMRAHQDGKVKLDLQATAEWIRKAQAIPDAAYREMLMPYASRRFSGRPGALEDFLQAALARKNGLQADFERFYSEIESTRQGKQVVFRFGETMAPAPAAAPGEVTWARGSRLNLEEEVKAIREAGWQGKTLAVDKTDIEDQNVLVREILLPGGGQRTVLQCKLRPEADQRLVAALKPRVTGKTADTALDDPYWDRLLAAIKTINHHVKAGDLSFNTETLGAAGKLRPELLDLVKQGNLVQQKQARHYLELLDAIEESVKKAQGGAPAPVGLSKPFSPSVADLKTLRKAADEKPSDGATVRVRDRWTEDKTEQKGSRIVLVRENVPLSEHDARLADKLVEYDVDLGQGVTAIYKPFQPGETAYALQGRLTVKIEDGVSEKAVARAMEKLRTLGLEVAPSSSVDEELMYLQKVATVAKVDTTPAFRLAAEEAGKATAPEEALRIWREAWGHELGVKDVTKLKGYNPAGVHQLATATGEEAAAGTRIQFRFDLDEKKLQKDMKDYVLTHHVTNGKTIESFFREVLPGNRAFVPTAERFSVGVPIGGMSPAADMNSGGASYFFTRIAKRGPQLDNVITLKVDMLRRADAISYNTDVYGRVTGDYVRAYRQSDVKAWKACAKHNNNETIFKGPVPILENLEQVIVSQEPERRRLISLFKEHGIETLPDGRKIKDVIVARR